MSNYTRLVRFLPQSSPASPLVGEPVDDSLDVGLATYEGKPIEVEVFSGSSILSPGEKTGDRAIIGRLSPLAQSEVGTIRCIGLNYLAHAKELNNDVPTVPTLFYKPATALSDPYPSPVIIPKAFVQDNTADYESEVVIFIGKDAKNVTEENALDHLLGFTTSNDISSRLAQFAQSQWCFSKSFDNACPIGPAIVSAKSVKDLKEIRIKGEYNGSIVQDSGLDDLIFSIPKIIAFLSQGTTLPAGTIILTGTPKGVGWGAMPRRTLQDGNEFRVYVSHGWEHSSIRLSRRNESSTDFEY